MRKLIAFGLGLALILPLQSAWAQNKLSKEEKKEGFQLLFDGKALKGWEGDPDLWRVENGEIAGSTDKKEIKTNQFLITTKEYGDFELRLEMKIRNGNSGVQFRSTRLDNFVVQGLQADAAHENWWGGVYDEKGTRGVMVNGWKDKAEKVVRNGDWNEMILRCKGEDISIKINGMETAALKDSVKMSGIIALQLHRGPGMEVRVRNVRIKELK
jgi:hypothetical protein